MDVGVFSVPLGGEPVTDALSSIDEISANFDPSQRYWQGIDVTKITRLLGDAYWTG